MKDSTKGKAMKVLFAGMAAVGAAFCPMNVGAAIYVNGVNASVKTSGGGSSDSPTYWRVTDGCIVLRRCGPYVIHGSGTTPIVCNAGSGKIANVTISNLTVTAKDKEYGAFDCNSQVVYLTVAGDNRLTSTAYSAKISRPALAVGEKATLIITNTLDTASLSCTSGGAAAGIGGGYDKGWASVSDNNAGSVIIYGGRITAQGGAEGGAGIGGGLGGNLELIRVRAGVVTTTGGGAAAGIGGGAGGDGGYYYQYDGTVTATRGTVSTTYRSHDIGRGGGSSAARANRLYVSGGSLTLGTGYATCTASNATERIYRCRVTGFTPGEHVQFEGLPDAYGQRRIYAQTDGFVDMRLPSGSYTFTRGELQYTATIESEAVTATVETLETAGDTIEFTPGTEGYSPVRTYRDVGRGVARKNVKVTLTVKRDGQTVDATKYYKVSTVTVDGETTITIALNGDNTDADNVRPLLAAETDGESPWTFDGTSFTIRPQNVKPGLWYGLARSDRPDGTFSVPSGGWMQADATGLLPERIEAKADSSSAFFKLVVSDVERE